jgi:hypothetical protein
LFATNKLFRGTRNLVVITNDHGNIHSRKKSEDPDGLGRYVEEVPIIHTVIKKNLPGWKNIQSIFMGITSKWEMRETGPGAHHGRRNPSMSLVGKKSFSKEKDPLRFGYGP